MTKLDAENSFTSRDGAQPVRRQYVFLLLPSYSPMSVCTAVEALSKANEAGATPAYSWRIVSQNGVSPNTQCGISLDVDTGLEPVGTDSTVIVCGGDRIDASVDAEVTNWLRKSVRFGAKLGAIGGGVGVLLETGLTAGSPVASHWSVSMALREIYPDIEITESVFELSGKVASCAGGATTLDMFLNLIARENSIECAQGAAASLAYASVRDKNCEQTMSLACRVGSFNASLEQAIDLIHHNLETPLPTAQIAERVGVSPRQLERLFAAHIGVSPMAYSTKIRLEYARTLLQQTRLPIIEVTLATGFQSLAHFSKLYRKRFSISPTEERGVTH